MTEMTDDFDSVLEQCLAQIASGRATIWSCLARHPDHSSELAPLLAAAEHMWAVPRPVLSAEARARIEQRVTKAAETQPQHRPATQDRRAPRRGWRLAIMGVTALLLVFLSVTLLVDTVGETLPGSPLHPIKRAAENTQLWLLPARERPQLRVELAQRRVDEVAALAEKGEVDPEIVEAVTKETEVALREVEELPAEEAAPLVDDLEQLISKQEQTISTALQKAKPASQPKVEEALETTAAQANRTRALASSLPVPPSITIQVTLAPDRLAEPGGEVQFAVTLSNDSGQRVTVRSMTSELVGDLNGRGSCAVPSEGRVLQPGQSYACDFRARIQGNGGQTRTDTVTVTASNDQGGTVKGIARAAVTFTDIVPAISVTAMANPSSVPEPGGDVEFALRVTNQGLEPVMLAALEDSTHGDLDGQGTCSLPPGQVVITPGDFYDCAFTANVSGKAGATISSDVRAVATDDEGNEVVASTSVGVRFSDVLPRIGVLTTASPKQVSEPGGLVTFGIRVTNRGGEEITLLALTKDAHGVLDGQGTCELPASGIPIAAGGMYECAFEANVAGNAGESQAITVTALVSDDEGNRVKAANGVLVTITDAPPEGAVSKTAEPSRLAEPGGTVRFTVRVRNPGAEKLTLEDLLDDTHGDLDGQGTCSLPEVGLVIDPGGSYTCGFEATVRGNAGDVHRDTVTAVVFDDEGNRVKIAAPGTVTITDVPPQLSVKKLVEPPEIPEPGGKVVYTVRVSNKGLERLVLEGLMDDIYGHLDGQGSCSVTGETVLIEPGDYYECSFTKQVSGNAGFSKADTVTAVVADDEGNQVKATARTKVTISDVLPTITVRKTATPNRLPEPGGTVEYKVQVTNKGVEAVILETLTDDLHGDLNGLGSCSIPGGELEIAAGRSYECAFAGDVAGLGGQSWTDSVTALVYDDEQNRLRSAGTATVSILDLPPAADVALSVEPSSIPESGGRVTFAVRVTNVSTESIKLESLSDDLVGALGDRGSCSIPVDGISLEPQGPDQPAQSYECSYPVDISGDLGKLVANRLTAVVSDDEGNVVEETGDATVSITNVLPSIAVSKTAEPGSVAEPGGTVQFTVQVSNDGPEVAALGTLIDDVYGDLNGQGTCSLLGDRRVIGPGEVYECGFAGAVSGNAGESVTSTVTAVVWDDEGNAVEDTGDATVSITDVLPSIAVSKIAEPVSIPEPGGTIQFTVRVGNQGPEPVALGSLVDDVYGDLNGQGTCSLLENQRVIGPGEVYECGFAGAVSGNAGESVTSMVAALVRDDERNAIEGQGSVTVGITDVPPSIAVSKAAEPGSVSEPGGTVQFTVQIRNDGPEVVMLQALVDDVYGNLSGKGTCSVLSTQVPIGPSEVYGCVFAGDVSGNAGAGVTNTITALVVDDEGNEVWASASAAVTITPSPLPFATATVAP